MLTTLPRSTSRKRASPPARDPATRYAQQVVAGKVVVGKLVRLACERHLRDLKSGKYEWDVDGDRWGSRLEVYKSDPREVPDMTKWETELLFRLKDLKDLKD